MTAGILLFTILQLADIYTTHRILSNGGSELNPVLAQLFKVFGHLPVLVLMKSGLVWLAYEYVAPYIYGDYVLGLMCAFYVWVVWHNWKEL